MARPPAHITFWNRVYGHILFDNGCYLFTGAKDNCGYGRINKNGKLVRLHRAVWERDNGEIPEKKVIMHSCDRPACINPAHLSLGSQQENIQDMISKKRHVALKGSRHAGAKIHESDIPYIREQLKSGATCSSLAKKFNVTEEAIRHIKKNRSWRHVP